MSTEAKIICPHCGTDSVTPKVRFCQRCSVYLTPFTAAALRLFAARKHDKEERG